MSRAASENRLALGRPRYARASHAAAVIVDAVGVLARHPHIGRPVSGPLRELVISHGRSGSVALYRVSPRRDRVEVLALRHQREARYHG
jgi:plasmid stabilization system protein ParE